MAALLQSLSTLTVKLTDGHVPVFELVAVRSISCFLITVAWGATRQQGMRQMFGQRSNLPLLVLRGCAGAGSMSCFYFGVLRLTVADAVTIFFTHPAFVVLLAFLWLGEAISWRKLAGIACSLLGVVVISKPPFLTGGAHWSSQHIIGVVTCLLSALMATVAYVTIRRLGSSETPLCLGLWFHTMGSLTSFLPLLLGIPDKPCLPRLRDCACMSVLIFTSFTSQAFIARAFQVESAVKSASAGYLQVVFGYIYGIAIFHDSISLYGLLGNSVICLGIVAVSWPSKDKGDQYHIISDALPHQEMRPLDACSIAVLAAEPASKNVELHAMKDIELPVSDSGASRT